MEPPTLHDTLSPRNQPFPEEFLLIRRLGGGAFGEVWLAEDLSPLQRLVALKFLHVAGQAVSRLEALEALKNEARLLGSLHHPNIVPVFAWRETADNSLCCLVLRYLAGGSLADRVEKNGALSWSLACAYIAGVGQGLLQAHRHGIIHRDVKPANMLLDLDADRALLGDFGISAHLAAPGGIAGTACYMAPEAFEGVIDPQSDVYSLAASLFWLVTKSTPFLGRTREELRSRAKAGLPAIDPRFANIPPKGEELLRSALHPESRHRPTLEMFVDQLRLEDVAVRLLLEPNGPRFRTTQRVRITVSVEKAGIVHVVNIGPNGNVTELLASQWQSQGNLVIGPFELSAPAGCERIIATWSRDGETQQIEAELQHSEEFNS
jgi:serine/threonine-protein kinase